MASSSKPLIAYNLRSQQPTRMKDFASDLKKALDAVTPTTEPYRDVSVLALHWENDQMGVANLNSELLKVFKDLYNFKVMSYQIPQLRSYLELQDRLSSWARNWGKKGLLRIVVYSGHAEFSGTTPSKWLIAGHVNAEGKLLGPTVDWMRISGVLESVEGDLLYIFDCCSAAIVVMEDGPETIAAAGWGPAATDSIHFSFTRALIDTLKDLAGAPVTIAGIYARLFRIAYRNQAGSCPVHVPKNGSSSITIQRIQEKEMQTLQALMAPYSNRASSEFRGEYVDIWPGAFMASRRLQEQNAKVLISVKVRDEVSELDIDSWTKWLTNNLPPGPLSVDVKVEAVFRGSGLFLVTLPLQLWTMLPANDTAYNFVAHVASNETVPD